jgi:hypothetical protein
VRRNGLRGTPALLVAAWFSVTALPATPVLAASPALSAPAQPLTTDAGRLYDWVVDSRDNEGLPFMIVDKRRAHLWVFDRSARLQGDAPVLLGSARGDHSVPGIGDMKLSEIKPADRTTPAGRFRADVGRNERGETVVWVDYDGGVSMHPVLTTNPKERREQRLATPTPDDNRISFGCINVPKAFHEAVVLGTVNRGDSIVYVLPEKGPLHGAFPGLPATPSGRVASARQ